MRRIALLVIITGFASIALADAASATQNLLANPGFDHSLEGWTVQSQGATTSWQAVDADGSSGSGSAKASIQINAPFQGYEALTQCLPVTPGTRYAYSAKVRSQTAITHVVLPFSVVFFTEPGCSAGSLGGNGEGLTPPHPDWVGLADTHAAPANAQSALVVLAVQSEGALETFEYDDVFFGVVDSGPCVPGPSVLCLDQSPGDHRFAVQATFASPPRNVQGTAHAVSTASVGITRGGLLWFFDQTNPELLVKVIDGCGVTQRFWVYIAAGTDVGVELTITDTDFPYRTYLFRSPDGSAFPSIQDVFAISCP